jgi:3-methyladenine DNA glycosylase AlkD
VATTVRRSPSAARRSKSEASEDRRSPSAARRATSHVSEGRRSPSAARRSKSEASEDRRSPSAARRATIESALAALEDASTARDRANLARFGITAAKAYGVSMASVQRLAKAMGRDHDLATALWESGWYEARLLASFVGDPARVTAPQMDRWCRQFDNWGVCDTICFHLFDRTPHAWAKVAQWHGRREEFVKRAAFALIASLALHDETATDAQFVESLAFVERAAADDRNFVKKGVSWALRVVGRRNVALHAAALATARRLAASAEPAARWTGKAAVRELTGPVVTRALARGGNRAGRAATASATARRRAARKGGQA